jgi:hypothetical protein
VLDGIYDTTAPGGAANVPPQGVAVRGYALDAGRRIGLGPDMNASPTILAVDVRTGATVGSAALPFLLPSFARVDASGRLAIVLSYRTLLLADLETGRSIVFLHAPRRIADAALEPTGLAYALAGHVHFVPYASLLARVAG